jgi:DNA-directed RNA polymerase subunit RPC12/RpoP
LNRTELAQCPICGGRKVRSERTRGLREKLLALAGYFAFRCLSCSARFLDKPLGLASTAYARCPKCYRFDLSTWDPSRYRTTTWISIRLWFGAHRWRCERCRINFASWRPRRQKYVRPTALDPSPPPSPDSSPHPNN